MTLVGVTVVRGEDGLVDSSDMRITEFLMASRVEFGIPFKQKDRCKKRLVVFTLAKDEEAKNLGVGNYGVVGCPPGGECRTGIC